MMEYNDQSKEENSELQVPDKCLRCKLANAEVMCNECYPFIYFCNNCDKYIHMMETKKHHQRVPLFQNINENENNENYQNDNYIYDDNKNDNNNFPCQQEQIIEEQPTQENVNTNENINEIGENSRRQNEENTVNYLNSNNNNNNNQIINNMPCICNNKNNNANIGYIDNNNNNTYYSHNISNSVPNESNRINPESLNNQQDQFDQIENNFPMNEYEKNYNNNFNNLNPSLQSQSTNNPTIPKNAFLPLQDKYIQDNTRLQKRCYFLEKKLNDLNDAYLKTVHQYKENICEMDYKNCKTQKSIQEQHDIEMSMVMKSNDQQINNLIKANTDLNTQNEQLVYKLKTLINNANENQMKNDELVKDLQNQIAVLKKEKSDLITSYEQKLELFNSGTYDDKKSIINSYEEQIKKIRKEYENNKKQLQEIVKQKENDYNKIYNENKNFIEKMQQNEENQKKKAMDLEEKYVKLENKLKEKDNEIKELKDKINEENSKFLSEFEKNKELLTEINNAHKLNKKMTKNIDYLNRITHGKFVK